MEKYFIHSNELHLIDVDKIHQAVLIGYCGYGGGIGGKDGRLLKSIF